MRRKKSKISRITSLLLAAAMIVTSVPQSALTVNAAEVDNAVQSVDSELGEPEDAVTNKDAGDSEMGKDAEGDVVTGTTPEDETSKEGEPEEENPEIGDKPDDAGSKEGSTEGGASEDGKSDGETSDINGTDGEMPEGSGTPEETDGTDEGIEPEEPEASQEDGQENDFADDGNVAEQGLEQTLADGHEDITINFGGNYEYFTVYDKDGNDITQSGFTVPYGSKDTLVFRIVPKMGYVVSLFDYGYDYYTQYNMQLSKTEINGGYECTISPIDEDTGYTYTYGSNMSIYATSTRKALNQFKFVYSDDDVEEIVFTNGTNQSVENNVPISISNEYDTSFKLKAKPGKLLAVSYKSDDDEEYYNDPFISYGVEDNEGYYFYDLGKLSENATITIQEGWKVTFEYDNTQVEELYREILIGDEDGLYLDESCFYEGPMIDHTVVVAKGEPLYFYFSPTEEYDMCIASVTDDLGNACDTINNYGEGGFAYKAFPEADMTIKIEYTPRTIPVTYEDGVIKNLSITSEEDRRVTYDDNKKEITNLYSSMIPISISFELEDGKNFDRVEVVSCYTEYDDELGEFYDYYEYYEVSMEKDDNGVYTSDEVGIDYDTCELRIIAGDTYTLNFDSSDEVRIYAYDRWGNIDIENEIDADNPQTVVKGDEYSFGILLGRQYELSTLYVAAESENGLQELQVTSRGTWYDGNEEKLAYACRFVPTDNTKILVSVKPKSVQFNYDQSALKNIEIIGDAKLSEDKSSININSYEELRDCEIKFELEEGKTFTGAYYVYTGRVMNEDWVWTNETRTYTENIGVSSVAGLYTINLSNLADMLNTDRIISLDSIKIVAGNACEINFDLPEYMSENYNNYIRIYDFKYDEYKDINLEQPVIAVENEEYLFGVELISDEYSVSSIHVTVGDAEEELPVKYYSRQEWQMETIPYYSFTPTEDASTVHIDIRPQSIPIKYTDSAVASLKLINQDEFDGDNIPYAPELSDDGKSVDIWGCYYPLEFELELESDSSLSRIFVLRSKVDDYGNKVDGYYEDDISGYTEDGKYHFVVYNYESNLAGIEIVTDKVNLSDCTVELNLAKDSKGNYYTVYQAKAIEPEVTVTYVSDGEKKILDSNNYTVTYENNRNAGAAGVAEDVEDIGDIGVEEDSGYTGSAVVTVKAKADSECTGSTKAAFNIVKAAAPEIATLSLSIDINEARESRELNLVNQYVIDTDLEKGVKPISYIVNTDDNEYTTGDVLAENPVVNSNYNEWQDLWTHVLIYSIKEDADKDSAKAVIVLSAQFENYEDAKILIEISMAEKETVIFDGYALKSRKKYDATPLSYEFSNLYLVDDNGLKLENSDSIMAELKDYIKFHYTGYECTENGSRDYDSYETPVNAGDYTLTVELSEENTEYTAVPYDAGTCYISRRTINVIPEAVNLNVGDTLPDTYSYRLTGDGLLEGDTMSSEPILSCAVANTNTAGKYRINVDVDDIDIYNSSGESVKYNYSIGSEYIVWLTITEASKTEITLIQKEGTQLSKTYDGAAFDGISLIEAKYDDTPVTDANIIVKYAGREGTTYAESETAPVNAGKYTMKAQVSGSDAQYKSNEITLDIEITKAAKPDLQEIVIYAQSVTEDMQFARDLTQYFSDGYDVINYGTVTMTDDDSILAVLPTVSDQGELSYTLKAGKAEGTAELTIPVEFRNYENASLSVKITLTSKTILTLSKNDGIVMDREYNGNEYTLPENAVSIADMPQDAAEEPKLTYTYTERGSSVSVTPIHAGQYTVTVTVSASDDNYAAEAPLSIDFEITKKAVNVTANSGNWNKVLEKHPDSSTYSPGCSLDSLVGGDEWQSEPTSYTYTYISDDSVVTLTDADDEWKALEEGTVIMVTPAGAEASDDYEIVYMPGELTVTGIPDNQQIYVSDIQPMVYTGKQLKPAVHVYAVKNGELIELTSKDYKVTYGTNKDAGTGTVTITGKGNYNNTVKKEFTIEKASIGNGSENKSLGITLKYTDQALNTKSSKLVTSLKYTKALKEGTDFTVTLTKDDVDDQAASAAVAKTEGTVAAKTPTGTDIVGVYKLRIEAKENTNYIGYIEKAVYIAGKDNLIKNAKITIKNKTLKWDDKEDSSYGNYDEVNWGGFYLKPGTSKTDAQDFTVSIGNNYLENKQSSARIQDNDSQYFITYTNNNQAGTATITIIGDGKTYFGTKSATFKIQGTAFKAGTKTGNIKLPDTLTAPETYTGKEVTKTVETLEVVGKTVSLDNETKPMVLTKNTDYNVEYKNNIKKGSATVIITAKPESGYTGSIKKSFKIQPAELKEIINNGRDEIGAQNVEINRVTGNEEGTITDIEYKGAVPYTKSGATISGLVFTNKAGIDLKQGTDYTVKYSYDNKDKKAGTTAVMTLKGKGNYSGTLDVKFTISKADYDSLDISVAAVKLGNKAVKPKVTVKDGKKALTVSEDGSKEVKVTYANTDPDKVSAWLKAGAPEGDQNNDTPAPIVTIEIMNTENYSQSKPEERILNIYSEKLDKKKITINWHDTSKKADFTYKDGEQVRPVIDSIKYNNVDYTVKPIDGEYYAVDSNETKVFKISYAANDKSGNNKGSVSIEALKLYGGTYTEKFTIYPKDISL